MAVLKKDVQNLCLGLVNEWLEKSRVKGKVIYKSWVDQENAAIKYENQPLNVKCDMAIFLNIDDHIYRIFIDFKINLFKYQLDARKKALLAQRKNGLVTYDQDAKHAFRVVQKDKLAIFLFVANDIVDDQINSWKSRVLCCYPDNIVPTIKHAISEAKATLKK